MNGSVPTPEIAVVVPVFNEEENLLPLAEEIRDALDCIEADYEIVFVDDASTDGTADKIREAQQRMPRVRGLRHERNAGQSAALWTGINATTSPIIVTMDGDRQNDPADLPRMLAALRDCDFVCGVRLKRRDNWVRRVSSKVARAARRSVLKVDFKDTGCAFRAFRREALQGTFGFNGVHRFLPVFVHAHGFRTREIPINHRARTAGVSKYGTWNRLWRGIYDLIAVAWYQKRKLPQNRITELTPEVSTARTVEPVWREFRVSARTPEFRPVAG